MACSYSAEMQDVELLCLLTVSEQSKLKSRWLARTLTDYIERHLVFGAHDATHTGELGAVLRSGAMPSSLTFFLGTDCMDGSRCKQILERKALILQTCPSIGKSIPHLRGWGEHQYLLSNTSDRDA